MEKIVAYCVGVFSFIVGIFLWGKSKEREGEQNAVNEANESALEAVEKSNEVENEVASLDSDTVKSKLFAEYGKRTL